MLPPPPAWQNQQMRSLVPSAVHPICVIWRLSPTPNWLQGVRESQADSPTARKIVQCLQNQGVPAGRILRSGTVPQQFHKLISTATGPSASLVGSEGNQYTGWNLDLPFPDDFSADKLADAMRRLPQVEKIRPCNFEQCILACPHSRKQ